MEAPSRRGIRTAVALGAVALLLVFTPLPGRAAGPTEQVKEAIDEVVEILGRPALTGEAKREARRALLRRAIVPVFDFDEMAKRSLGVHWKSRTPGERDDFVKVFRDVLENSYLGKIEAYRGERILYLQEKIDPPYAEVNTLIVTTKGQEYPVNYLMRREGDRWRIYDVVIEGISLVNNYRSQFGDIIRRSSFDDLMSKLRAAASRTKGA